MVFFTLEFTLGPSPSRSVKWASSTGHPSLHSTADSAQDSELTADIVNWDTTGKTHYYFHLILHLPFLREDPPFLQRIKHNLHYSAQGKKLWENYKFTWLRQTNRNRGTTKAFDPFNLRSHRSERDSSQHGRQCSGCFPATLRYQWGTVSPCGYTRQWSQRPIKILPTSTGKASPEGGRRQKLDFLGEMTWGTRRLVYHLSLEWFSELVISENLPHG